MTRAEFDLESAIELQAELSANDDRTMFQDERLEALNNGLAYMDFIAEKGWELEEINWSLASGAVYFQFYHETINDGDDDTCVVRFASHMAKRRVSHDYCFGSFGMEKNYNYMLEARDLV